MKTREMMLLIPIAVLVLGLFTLAYYDRFDWSSKIDIGHFFEIMVLVVLVLVTAVYAGRTSSIANATKQQADASVRMAKYMVKPRLDPDFWLEGYFSQERQVKFNAWVHNTGQGSAYDLELWIEDDSIPPSKLITHGYKTTVLRPSDSRRWSQPSLYLDFPHSEKVQRRVFVIKYKDIDGEYEIRQPFVLETVEDDKPYARLESISRKKIREINLEEGLP